MKIKKVKWDNHPILGNLELDFINDTTRAPFNTIIFVGANGAGKTTILESISTFLNLGSFEYFEIIEYIIDGRVYKATPSNNHRTYYNRTDDKGTVTQCLTDKKLIDRDTLDIRHYGCIFSKARADYKTAKITSTTTKTLDLEKYDIDTMDDFTSSKQLLVDIQTQDSSEYANINETLGESPKSWPEFYPNSKMYRFKNAFNQFFDKLKYKKVDDIDSEKQILFEKNAKEISIDKLSTGEKQIVFRGIYLLKNSKNLNGATIMIDEPELSMHPKWQKNIMKYYKDLFTEYGAQKTQLFFATHSEHVLNEALKDKNNNLVIVLNEFDGVINAKKIDSPSLLPSITHAEINYFAFDIVSNDYHIELYSWLQERFDRSTVKSCDTYIQNYMESHNLLNMQKESCHNKTTYSTLSTFIRNTINHYDSKQASYTDTELRMSIELLRDIIKQDA